MPLATYCRVRLIGDVLCWMPHRLELPDLYSDPIERARDNKDREPPGERHCASVRLHVTSLVRPGPDAGTTALIDGTVLAAVVSGRTLSVEFSTRGSSSGAPN